MYKLEDNRQKLAFFPSCSSQGQDSSPTGDWESIVWHQMLGRYRWGQGLLIFGDQ